MGATVDVVALGITVPFSQTETVRLDSPDRDAEFGLGQAAVLSNTLQAPAEGIGCIFLRALSTFRGFFMAICVLRPIGVIGIVVTTLVASSDAGIGAPANTAGADDCLNAPNSPASADEHWYYHIDADEHWYYHIDRAKQHKCWYLRSSLARQTEAQPTSEDVPAIHNSREKSAQERMRSFQNPARSAGDPASTRADGAAVAPDIRTPEPASIPDRSTLQESAGQSRITTPPSPTPQLQPESPITAPSDAQRGNAKVPDSRNVRSARKTGPTINSKIAKLPGTLNFLALVLVLGLIAGMAGDLWRAVRKLVSVRRQSPARPITADAELPVAVNEDVLKREDAVGLVSQQIDSLLGTPRVEEDQRQQEWREDQQQSLTRPVTANDEWPSNANEKHGVVASNSEVLKSGDALERLSQEIDRLPVNPNKKDGAFRDNTKVLKPDDALERLSQEIDELLQKSPIS